MPLFHFFRSYPFRLSNSISTRATLAAASAPRVRVTFPRGNSRSPAGCATPAPAAAQRRHASRNHRRSPAGTARPTFSRWGLSETRADHARGSQAPISRPAGAGRGSAAKRPRGHGRGPEQVLTSWGAGSRKDTQSSGKTIFIKKHRRLFSNGRKPRTEEKLPCRRCAIHSLSRSTRSLCPLGRCSSYSSMLGVPNSAQYARSSLLQISWDTL